MSLPKQNRSTSTEKKSNNLKESERVVALFSRVVKNWRKNKIWDFFGTNRRMRSSNIK